MDTDDGVHGRIDHSASDRDATNAIADRRLELHKSGGRSCVLVLTN